MDQPQEKHSIEAIKNTMRMHEEIFKHQVKELHRLYNVQRMLMDELKRDIKKQSCKVSSSAKTFKIMPTGFDLEQPAENEMPTQCCVTGEDRRSLSSLMNPTVLDVHGEESDVELTLSIGGSRGKEISKFRQPFHSPELSFYASIEVNRKLDSSAFLKSNSAPDRTRPKATMSTSSASFNQQRERSHWLDLSFSLNSTT